MMKGSSSWLGISIRRSALGHLRRFIGLVSDARFGGEANIRTSDSPRVYCHRMAAEGMQFSWRWNGGTISRIWGLSGKYRLSADGVLHSHALTLAAPVSTRGVTRQEGRVI